MDIKHYITTVEAAKELGITRAWVHNLIKTGVLRAYRLGDRHFVTRAECKRVKKARESLEAPRK